MIDYSMLHLDRMIQLGYRGGKAADRCRLAPGVSRTTQNHEGFYQWRYEEGWTPAIKRRIGGAHATHGGFWGYLPAENWHAVY